MGSSRIFAFSWWRRRPVGAGWALVALQPRLEELRDPLEGRVRLGGGRALVDFAGMLAHGDEDGEGESGWWLVAVVGGSVAACVELYGGGEAVQ
jgi:hypothetical protein